MAFSSNAAGNCCFSVLSEMRDVIVKPAGKLYEVDERSRKMLRAVPDSLPAGKSGFAIFDGD